MEVEGGRQTGEIQPSGLITSSTTMQDTPDKPNSGSNPGSQRITFLGSQPPVGPPRNANVAMDRVRPNKPESVRPTPAPPEESEFRESQKFPAILLIAPGFISLLFAASAAQFVGDGKGRTTALLIGLAGMLAAIACFGALAAYSREKGMQMFCAVMIGVALLAYAQSYLALS